MLIFEYLKTLEILILTSHGIFPLLSLRANAKWYMLDLRLSYYLAKTMADAFS